jgi:hypothetical protein
MSEEEAVRAGEGILAWARKLGGVVCLLWHNQSFVAPRFWGRVYERLIEAGKRDAAWIALPREALAWFERRRACQVQVTAQEDGWTVRCCWPESAAVGDGTAAVQDLPPVRLRLHIPPERIAAVSVAYETGDGYIDVAALDGEIRIDWKRENEGVVR